MKANPQVGKHIEPDSQAASLCMLSEWELIQRSTIGQSKQYEDDHKKH